MSASSSEWNAANEEFRNSQGYDVNDKVRGVAGSNQTLDSSRMMSPFRRMIPKNGHGCWAEKDGDFNVKKTKVFEKDAAKVKLETRNDFVSAEMRAAKRRKLSYNISGRFYDQGLCLRSEDEDDGKSCNFTSCEKSHIENIPAATGKPPSGNSLSVTASAQIPETNPDSMVASYSPARSRSSSEDSSDEEQITVNIPQSVLDAFLNRSGPSKGTVGLSEAIGAFISSCVEGSEVVGVSQSPSVGKFEVELGLKANGRTDEEPDGANEESTYRPINELRPPDGYQSAGEVTCVSSPLQVADVSGIQAHWHHSTSTGDYTTLESLSVPVDCGFQPEMDRKELDWRPPPAVWSSLQYSLGRLQLEELQLADHVWNDHRYNRLRRLRVSSIDQFTPTDFFDKMYNGTLLTMKQYGQLTSVKNLSLDDQSILLKTGIMELLTIRGITKYNSKTGQINIQNPGCEYIDIRYSDKVFKDTSLTAYKECITSFPERWRRDELTMMLLGVMVFFNPHRPSLQNKVAVEREQLTYRRLLKDHLESTYGVAQGGIALNYFITRMNQLPQWTRQNAAKVTFEIDMCTMEPFAIEVSPQSR